MKVAAVLVCLVFAVAGALPIGEEEALWKAWKGAYGKTYTTSEELTRKTIWRDNLRKIKQHNSEGHSYTLALNSFGDLTGEEFRYYYTGLRMSNGTKQGSLYMEPNNVVLPTSVDWRQHGYVTPVKNQGQCGSCWAFSTTGSLEGQHFKRTGRLVSLSEQNLVDCSKSNYGCNGGWVDVALSYIRSNGGIDTEGSYPYEGRNGWCRFKRDSIGATDTGYIDIQRGDEQALKSASATVGPISVAVDATHFQFYNGGVMDNPSCSTTQLDHAVLVVGYGTYQGQDYWLVKNSWGTGWGMSGYLMMSRNKGNQCGIATSASYPLV